MFKQLAVIGCGLMGGSFALALRRAGLVERIVGYSKSPSTTEKARRMGVIDQAAESALLAVSGADIVLMAVPVSATEATLRAIAPLIEPGVLLMDVGSTKRDVVDAAVRSLKSRLPSFVPAHPIAGKELAGIEHADASLYQGQKVILTPLEQTSPGLVEKATEAWTAIGSNVRCMTPQQHDAAFAAVSHLPHLLAFGYINGVARQPDGAEFMALAGPGFRDFSRIAASDATVWRDILMANGDEVAKQLQHFRQAIDAIEYVMKSGNAEALEELIRAAAQARAAWPPGRHGKTV
jgi:prephenate dehydrogenase